MNFESSDAVLDGDHRYALWRITDAPLPPVLFVGLNPSTADATTDDHTIRRCRYYAERWGYGGILMGNLYTLRSTDPAALLGPDPVNGDQADVWLERMARHAGCIVACWGATKHPNPYRVDQVTELLTEHGDVFCLGTTAAGHPRHPSRLANDVELDVYRDYRPRPAVEQHPHPHDVCQACGHLRSQHNRTVAGDTCLCWMPWRRPDATKSMPSLRDLPPIEYVTELALRTNAKGQTGDWQSSICACRGFERSGLRFRPEDDAEARQLVRLGKLRRTLVPVP